MHEWLRRIYLAGQNGMLAARGSLYDTAIEHKEWCPYLRGNGFCNCNPKIIITFWKLGHSPPDDPPDGVFEINSEGESVPVSGQN